MDCPVYAHASMLHVPGLTDKLVLCMTVIAEYPEFVPCCLMIVFTVTFDVSPSTTMYIFTYCSSFV